MALIEKNLDKLPAGIDKNFTRTSQAWYGFFSDEGIPLYSVSAPCYTSLFINLKRLSKGKQTIWVNFRLKADNRNHQKVEILRDIYRVFKNVFPDTIISYGPDPSKPVKINKVISVYVNKYIDKSKNFINYSVKINQDTTTHELLLLGNIVRLLLEHCYNIRKNTTTLVGVHKDLASYDSYGHLHYTAIYNSNPIKNGEIRGYTYPKYLTNSLTFIRIATEFKLRHNDPKLFEIWGRCLENLIINNKIPHGAPAMSCGWGSYNIKLVRDLDIDLLPVADEFIANLNKNKIKNRKFKPAPLKQVRRLYEGMEVKRIRVR